LRGLVNGDGLDNRLGGFLGGQSLDGLRSYEGGGVGAAGDGVSDEDRDIDRLRACG
jgi:hypothetical protein